LRFQRRSAKSSVEENQKERDSLIEDLREKRYRDRKKKEESGEQGSSMASIRESPAKEDALREG